MSTTNERSSDLVHGNLSSEDPIYDEAGTLLWGIEYSGTKAETSVPKPFRIDSVSPNNLIVRHVPRVLQRKSQVKINLLCEGLRKSGQTMSIIVKKNLLIENENLIANCLSNQLLFDVEKSRCLDLEAEMSKVHNESKHISKLNGLYYDDSSCEPYKCHNDVTDLLEQNGVSIADIERLTALQRNCTLEGNLKVAARSSVKTKVLAPGVNTSTEASGSKPRSNTKKNRIMPAKSENKKKVEDHPRTNKSVWTKVNRVDSSISSKRVVINSNSESVCKTCNKCLNSANHEMCVVNILSSVNATPTVKIVLNKGKQIWKPKGKLSNNSLNKSKRVWKAMGKLFADIGYQWRPTGKRFTLGKLNCGYQWRPTGKKFALGELCPLTKLSVKCCSKHMTGNRSKLKNFMEKFIGTVRFRNDHFGAIMGYGDYVIGDSVISRVYYVEGLGHNLFSVGQFCDSDLEIAFRKHSCFVRDMNGVDLLKGSRSTNLYTISIDDMMKSSLVCLLSKASKTKSWLWHRRLNHLNFGTINDLARKDLVRGLPRLKFAKDHLCSACQLGKSKKYSHKPKSKNTNMEVLHTLHMDLCGPMRVQSINGKKYILVIVDDYSRFTWVKFLRSKDETPEFVINFLKQIQVGLNKTVRYIRTDNGTEFVNQVMSKYYEGVGIFHQKSVPRTPQQNGVVERRNRTLVEAARTMLIFSKAPMFLWAEVVATACYTQNRSLIHTRHNKTPYELVHDKKPDLTFLRVFGALCYPISDSEDLGRVFESTTRETHRLKETNHVTFDEMHSDNGTCSIKYLEPSHHDEPWTNSFKARPSHVPATTNIPPTDKDLEILFQPMFDEYFEQSTDSEPVPMATVVYAPIVSTNTSVSTMIAQDAPSTSHSLSSSQVHPLVFPQGEPSSTQSTSGDVSLTEPNQVTQPRDHLKRWTKDHPLDNIVGNPSCPVSTRKQLASDALWCCFHTELSKVEPKNFKMAVIEDCWFQDMQVEVHEFDRLKVWELVPHPIYVMVIALKWIYKVKLDKLVDEDEVQPAPEPHMDDYEWIIASQDETTGPSVHPEDATSTKMVRETLSHADAESGGNSEKINSETDTEILNVGSNSEQSHVALAGPNPEHMHDVFLATNYPKWEADDEEMAPVRISSGPEPIMMTPGQLNSGLAPSPVPATTYIPPTDKDLEILFQPMFNEYFDQSTDGEPVPTATVVNALIVSTNTSVSTTIAQDAPSTSHSLSSSQVHPPVFPQGVAAGPTIEDTSITQADLHPSVNPVAGEPSSAQSTSGDVSLAEPNQVNQPPDHLRKWTKDHPLDNIVGNPSRPVSTRKQLASDALWCCYHTVLSKVEPKNFKMAVNEDSWFEAMQDEIHEFDRLKVWELVPRPPSRRRG
ncbi:retrovirus-related pol polyprotein from transposon TNT 1-94 [Tanacetum coccineum]